jgi:hypothetical protein
VALRNIRSQDEQVDEADRKPAEADLEGQIAELRPQVDHEREADRRHHPNLTRSAPLRRPPSMT